MRPKKLTPNPAATWRRAHHLCLRAADTATNRAVLTEPLYCMEDSIASRLVKELAPKSALGLSARIWMNRDPTGNDRGSELKRGEGEVDLPGYSIEARYVLEMFRWCRARVAEGKLPVLHTAWRALAEEAPFDTSKLASHLDPHLMEAEAYCEALAGKGQSVLASSRHPAKAARTKAENPRSA